MSNNRKVDIDGDPRFFANADSRKVAHIDIHPTLIFQTDDFTFIDCYREATITQNKKLIEEKWVDRLERWFPEVVETPDVCLIKVSAHRVQYWSKDGAGEYKKNH